jgi:Ser/Thr protein kinase RdoA (MazF antagonist)
VHPPHSSTPPSLHRLMSRTNEQPRHAVRRAAARGFGVDVRGAVTLSTQFGKCCLRVRTWRGALAQLRLVQDTGDTGSRLGAEMEWLEILAQARLRVPRPLPWSTGNPVSPALPDGSGGMWRAVCCTWVPGRHLDAGLRSGELRRIGAVLGRLHTLGVSAPAHIVAARPTWGMEHLLLLATTLRDIASGTITSHRGVSPETIAGLRTAHDELTAAISILPTTPNHVGLIHTDVHQWNIRISRCDVGLLDFEDFGTGRFSTDLASLQLELGERSDATRLFDALLDGYAGVRTPPREFGHDLRVMQAFRHLDLAGWVLSWPRITLHAWGPAFLEQAPRAIRELLAASRLRLRHE